MAEPGWQRCPQGLFLDVPHLLLTEHAWDPAAQTSSTLFMAIEESGKVTRFGSQMTAWRDDAYLDLLRTAGLTTITRPDEAEWPVSETFAGKLYALLAEKTFPILFVTPIKGIQPLDIPRIFTISESAHRIHNPFTPEKYAALGRVLRMKAGTRLLDLGSGSGEMLTWGARPRHRGIGVDMSALFSQQAQQRVEELGVADSVTFIHQDAAGYVAEENATSPPALVRPGSVAASPGLSRC